MSHQDRTSTNVYNLGAYDAVDMIVEVRDFRARLIAAWRERAVMMTLEEQAALRQEIHDTCALLTELTK